MSELAKDSKSRVLLKMLDEGTVTVLVDARPDAVLVPPFLKNHEGGYFPGSVPLNFSYRFGLTDFSVTEEYIEASLSFQGENFFCHVPMRYIWGMRHPYEVDEVECIIFSEDCPKDVYLILRQTDQEHYMKTISSQEDFEGWMKNRTEGPGRETKRKERTFKVIKGGKS